MNTSRHFASRKPLVPDDSSRGGWAMVEIVAALVAGHGVHWFITCASAASMGRTIAVAVQVLGALALAIYCDVRRRRAEIVAR